MKRWKAWWQALLGLAGLEAQFAEMGRAREQAERSIHDKLGEHASRIDALAGRIESDAAAANAKFAALELRMSEAASRAQAYTDGQVAELRASAQEQAAFNRNALQELKRTTSEEFRQTLSEELKRTMDDLAPPFPQLPRAGNAPAEPWFYAGFEQMFRGTRAEIAERLEVHAAVAERAWSQTEKRRVIDLGCGRGEWLQLLGTRGIPAVGIDTNAEVLASCRTLGLDVHQADAVDYLRTLEAGSVSVVTAFHVVEHVAVNRMMSMLMEVERVLTAGGIVILETPDPDNLVVGADTFWLDPSHRRPIPARMLRFCVESAGLSVLDVMRLGEDQVLLARAREESWPPGVAALLGGARDYAIVAFKPS